LNTNIYFIGSTELGAVKIGRADDPYKRLIELQTGNPHRLTLFNVVKDVSPHSEQICHNKMDHLRLHGEWFKLTDELISLMMNAYQIIWESNNPDPEVVRQNSSLGEYF